MNDDRDSDGRFAPGNRLGTPFGPDNPPPRSPGRPRKGAWVRELEDRVKDPRIRQGLADRLLKIALKGRDGDALKALQEIEDRTGKPSMTTCRSTAERWWGRSPAASGSVGFSASITAPPEGDALARAAQGQESCVHVGSSIPISALIALPGPRNGTSGSTFIIITTTWSRSA